MIRLITVLIALSLVACDGTKKENVTETRGEVKEEPAVDRGVTIQEQSGPDSLKGSLKAFADAVIGEAQISLNYYSPAVRGRVIWGGLVPYDQVWVTGAHKATSIEFDRNIRIGDTTIEPGKYALFTIPGREQWAIIFNKNWDQHLTDEYDQKDDVVRVQVDPTRSDQHQERLRYQLHVDNATNGHIEIQWEKVVITLPFEVI